MRKPKRQKVDSGKPSSVYCEELRLSNVKAFSSNTVLDLRRDGRPAPWTLILGDNGLGKTTLLQCLALMRPELNVKRTDRTAGIDPDWVEPALPIYDDELLIELARVGDGLKVGLEASFVIGHQLREDLPVGRHLERVSTGATYCIKDDDLSDFRFSKKRRENFIQPLLVAYSAARHTPYPRNEEVSETSDHAASFFNPKIELADVGQVLENLDYLTLRGDKKAEALYNSIKEAIACILPEVENLSRIHVYGPSFPGRVEKKSGVWFETYSGKVPLSSLSIGYQTMAAWTVDLAWRMAEHHEKSDDPLREPAIVLIDELDLHLHPNWQRRVRRDLSKVFPKVQFIVTTHSPVLAQTYLDTNIAIVTQEGDHAVINNEPKVVRSWRLDQVSAGLMHDIDPYAPEIIDAFKTRHELLGKRTLSASQKKRLLAANALVADIPAEEDPGDQEAVQLIREAAQLLSSRAK